MAFCSGRHPIRHLGLCLPLLLPNGPAEAPWLNAEEKAEIARDVAPTKESVAQDKKPLLGILTDPRVLLLAFVYFGLMAGLYGISFWLPQLVKEQIVSDKNNLWAVGGWSAIPWAVACLAMLWNSQSSDRSGNRRTHVAVPMALAALALLALTLPNLVWQVKLGLYCVLTAGVLSGLSAFWVIPSQFLTGFAAAAGIAWINSLGNIAGYVSPMGVKWFRKHFSTEAALQALAGLLAMAAGLLGFLKTKPTGEK